jgi:HAD superfamily hydrolase (TIGR01549 family)
VAKEAFPRKYVPELSLPKCRMIVWKQLIIFLLSLLRNYLSKYGGLIMITKPYLLFDAGGTLVFPDPNFLCKTAYKYGIELSDAELFKGYYELIYRLDRQASEQGFFSRNPWPHGYAYAVLETIGIPAFNIRKIANVANIRHRRKNLWTFTFQWVHETLSYLKDQGYIMSVLSNSDGRTQQVFDELNLTQYFEYIFDSHNLKVEKPDRRIYRKVLSKINVSQENVILVGDIFEVDIKGANLAGLGAIHIDPLGLYADFPGVHLVDITSLGKWLFAYQDYSQILVSDLFPFNKDGSLKPVREEHRTYPAVIDNVPSYDKSLESYSALSSSVRHF